MTTESVTILDPKFPGMSEVLTKNYRTSLGGFTPRMAEIDLFGGSIGIAEEFGKPISVERGNDFTAALHR